MKLICFDLDDTLWDFEDTLSRAEATLHRWLDEHYPDFSSRHSIDDLRLRRGQLLQENADLRHDIGRVRLLAMQHAAEDMGYDTTAAKRLSQAAFKKFMVHRNDVQLFDDVMPVLKRLRQEYTLCSLTNGNADLHTIGIADVFHHRLSAEQVGAAKPAPRMFLEACRLADAKPHEAVHVGDDPHTDVFAARAVGMKTVWVNRRADDWTHDEGADVEITSLVELEDRLRELLAKASA